MLEKKAGDLLLLILYFSGELEGAFFFIMFKLLKYTYIEIIIHILRIKRVYHLGIFLYTFHFF